MPSANRVVLASAGSGKTYRLVTSTGANAASRSALVTYTINGRDEINRQASLAFRSVPPHLTVSTWYQFVLSHFVRPYQNRLYEPRVDRITFIQSAPVWRRRFARSDITNYYFSSTGSIWQDRVTDFACRLIEETGGLPIHRIERIFDELHLDEVQDLSGWDLELIEHLLRSNVRVSMVGDHRQATYSTNMNPRNSQYRGQAIVKKFEKWERKGLLTVARDTHSYRCNQYICTFADAFFPDFPATTSLNVLTTGHDGLFFVAQSHLPEYMARFNPQPLRYNRTQVVLHGEALNFGESKGMTFDRVLIYPHKRLLKYLATGNLEDVGEEVEKAYVAVTRARHSVGFVVPHKFSSVRLPFFQP